ncbi:MAG: carboxypeptidase regulatory-like domain-containing protein [Acidobacteria bacterium]|nr:carboxypeptidase regulatory-like domain-containing protein [Acidobacteriota bacterium]
MSKAFCPTGRNTAQRYITLFLAIVLCAITASAQQDQGTITGTIADQTGAVVPNATVTIREINTGFALDRKTDAGGTYTVSPLKIGTYQVKATAAGFQTAVANNLHLHAQERLGVNLELQIGTSETVTVTSEGATMQTEEASTGQVVSAKTINDTPLNGRNYLYIAQLTAGVLPPTQGSRGEARGDFSANGQRPEQNNFILDGVDNNVNLADFLNNASYVIKPPPDALQEFSVQTSDYSAELGHNAGGVVNASIRSGTNQIHGSLWEYFRNDIFNNRDYFQATKPPYRQNQFGATLGVPLIKNKLFIFGDVEASRIIFYQTGSYNVPTLRERQSGYTDYSDLLVTGAAGNGRNTPAYLFQPGGPSTRDASGNGTNNFLACNGVKNTLCSSQVTPTSKAILNLFPLPNTGASTQSTSNYYFQQKVADNTTQYDVRMDWNISQNDQTFARYSYSQEPRLYQAPLGPILDGGAFGASGNIETEGRNFTFSETHIFTPKLTNEIRFGYNWIHAAYLQENIGTNVSESLGLNGIPFGPLNGGLVGLSITGLSRAGSPSFFPSSEYENVVQLLDNVTMVRGKHSIKIGVNLQRIRPTTLQPTNPKGAYTFSGRFTQDPNNTGTTGSGIADFAQEQLASSSINNIFTTNDQRWYDAAFIQDDWKITPRLTVNLGLRWEFAQPLTEIHGYQANLVPSFNSGVGGATSNTAASGTYLIPKKAQNITLPPALINALASNNITLQYSDNNALINSVYSNFAPRFGFAFSPTDRLVIRSGFGIFYGGLENLGYGLNLGGSSPFSTTSSSIAAVASCKPGTCYGPTYGGLNQTITSYQPTTLQPGTGTSVGFSAGITNGQLNPLFIAAPGLKSYDVRNQTPYTMGYNLAFEYQVSKTSSATISYVGNVDRHLGLNAGLNSYAGLLPAGTSYTKYLPFPSFGSGGSYVVFSGMSNYNSLQAKFEKHATQNLSFLATYTYSHALDNARPPLGGTGQSSYRLVRYLGAGFDYGSDLQDIRQRATLNGQYTLPFGKGQAHLNGGGFSDIVAGGWAAALTFRVQTGQPVDLAANNTLGNGNAYPLKVAEMGPFSTGGTAVANPCATATRTVAHWFNPCAFVNPPNVPAACSATVTTNCIPLGSPVPAIYYGAQGTTQVPGPGYNRVDMSLFKNFTLYRESRLQFRIDGFNIMNTPAYGQPATNVGGGGGNVNGSTETGTFGQITHLRFNGIQPDSRLFQFSLKFIY